MSNNTQVEQRSNIYKITYYRDGMERKQENKTWKFINLTLITEIIGETDEHNKTTGYFEVNFQNHKDPLIIDEIEFMNLKNALGYQVPR